MIKNKRDLELYIVSDRKAKFQIENFTLKRRLKLFISPDYVWSFQLTLRKLEYYSNCKKGLFNSFFRFLYFRRFKRLSMKLGFTIPINVFGPGLAIVHYGTIVINDACRIGANCRLHTSVNIGTSAGSSSKSPRIGNNCYIGPGAKIFGDIVIANGIAIGANAVVNKSFLEEGIKIAGIPARKIGEIDTKSYLHIGYSTN